MALFFIIFFLFKTKFFCFDIIINRMSRDKDLNIPLTPEKRLGTGEFLTPYEQVGRAFRKKRIPKKALELDEEFQNIVRTDNDDKTTNFEKKYENWKGIAIDKHYQYLNYLCKISSDIEDGIIQLQEILDFSDKIIDENSATPFSTVKKERDGKRKRKSKSRRRRRKSKSKF